MKKRFLLLSFIVFWFIHSCSNTQTDTVETNNDESITTQKTELIDEETSVDNPNNLATSPQTCYQGNMEDDLIQISLTIQKGVVSGTQYHIMDGIGVAEECLISGKFVEGEFNISLKVLEPRTGEVIETKN